MCSLFLVLVLLGAFDPGFSHVLDVLEIVWPEEYHYKGEVTDLSVGIIEPFEIWYSTEHNKSRIDLYGGTVKRYYVAETEEEMGEEYQIYPRTGEGVEPEIHCERDSNRSPQMNFLIDASNYTFADTIIYEGKTVEIWQHLEVELDEKKILQELYVYRNEENVDILLRRETKKYNLWTGALEKHVITTYFDYSKPSEDDLNIQLVEACEDSSSSDLHKDLKVLHPIVPGDLDKLVHSYKKHHNRNYKANEHKMRKSILKKNWERMIDHNKQNLGFKMTINKFSDRTQEELAYIAGTRPSQGEGTVPFPHTAEEVEQLVLDLPENYDMRIEGVISSVKNQGECGSCWTFSTAAAVEGALARKNGGRDLDLSEQSIVDCAWGFMNGGCNGGMIDTAFKYILAHGIPTQMEYGDYLAQNGYCHIENMTEVYTIQGFAHVPATSINAMKVALYKYGPVSVAVNADDMMMAYSSGVFFDPLCNKKRINHAITVVGYGVRDGATYWIVKNSWGEEWGQDGYILMSATDNNCHLLEDAYYPLV